MKDLSAAVGHTCGAQGMLKCICMMVNYVCKALTIVGTVWGQGRTAHHSQLLGQGAVSELRGPQGSPGGSGRALKAELRIESMVAFAFLGSLSCLAGVEHSWSS